jgi:hypothetical protein
MALRAGQFPTLLNYLSDCDHAWALAEGPAQDPDPATRLQAVAEARAILAGLDGTLRRVREFGPAGVGLPAPPTGAVLGVHDGYRWSRTDDPRQWERGVRWTLERLYVLCRKALGFGRAAALGESYQGARRGLIGLLLQVGDWPAPTAPAGGGSKRPCQDRDRTFLRWQREGKTAAKIRDCWNDEHPRNPVTLEVVKKGLAAARRDENA